MKIGIGLVGLGTVGTGVVKILTEQRQRLLATTGLLFEIKGAVVRHLDRPRDPVTAGIPLYETATPLLEDPSIAIIVEVRGSIDASRQLQLAAFAHGKSVVTANKDLVATAGSELAAAAKQHQVQWRYEAAVAGGIPIIRTVTEAFVADPINALAGILNGTTNYMLSQMAHTGMSYEQALTQAQANGFAEADPTNDVDGIDAAYKLVILLRLAMGVDVRLDQLSVTGIRQVTAADQALAAKSGYQLKLIALAQRTDAGVTAMVAPMLVPLTDRLAGVQGADNAVEVTSLNVDHSFLLGPGAGERPTANSVVSDLVSVGLSQPGQVSLMQPPVTPEDTPIVVPVLPYVISLSGQGDRALALCADLAIGATILTTSETEVTITTTPIGQAEVLAVQRRFEAQGMAVKRCYPILKEDL